MNTTIAHHVARYAAASVVGIGLIAATAFGAEGIANAGVSALHHGPIESPSSIPTKSVVPSMNFGAQDQPAKPAAKRTPGAKPAITLAPSPTKVNGSSASMSHTGPVIPPTMRFSAQDHPETALTALPTQVDTSAKSVSHIGPVIPPTMNWNEQDMDWTKA